MPQFVVMKAAKKLACCSEPSQVQNVRHEKSSFG